jgi:hypothetical protein
MKKKLFLLVLALVVTMFLVGCSSGIVTPVTDEAKIKSVINEFCLAINDQDWSKAKSYCVYKSEEYYKTCYMEDEFNTLHSYCDLVTINFNMDIYDVSIYGDYSEVYGYLTLVMSACGQFNSDSGYFWEYLQKVGNSWKLY